MLKIDIIAVGQLKKGPLHDLFKDYALKIRWKFQLHEIESKYRDEKTMQDDENMRLQSLIDPSAFVIALDERGNGLKSLDFSKTIENLQNNAQTHIQFIIGGANGLQDETRNRANMLLSFGQQTWPHMLARVMLVEQIYRAQQIMIGHPYHRE